MALSLCSVGASTLAAAQQPESIARRVDRVFARFDRADSPGCAVGIGRGGSVLYTHAYGSANLEYEVPLTAASVFESGSVAKQFTAAAIVLLAQQGKLTLEDDIRKYLPEVPDFGETIRIRHLLNHTSGLRDQWALLGIEGRGPGTQVHSPATTLDLVVHQKALNFSPGTDYLYSNTGYTLLGVIVQRVSGQTLDAFTQAQLFRPLGMTQTRWRDDFTAIVKGRATAYSGAADRGFRTDMSFTNIVGNGGLLTTVGDLLKWNENFVNPTVGGRALVDSMQTRAVLRNGRRLTYALGLDVDNYDGVAEVSHGGSTAGYRTFLARFPEQRVSIAVLCNLASANPAALAHQVADVVLTKPARAVQSGVTNPATLTAAQLERWAGSYVEKRTEQVLRFATRDGKLVNANASEADFTPVSPDRFRGRGMDLVFGGTAPHRSLLVVRQDGDTAVMSEVQPVNVSVTRLADYVGTYASDELDVKLTIALVNGQLVLRRRPADEGQLRPLYEDSFDGLVGAMRFSRDANGRVTGFGIFNGRARNVRFNKVGP
jgi:CubicO group peptidase (beta-lactamase class C family)